MKDRIAQALGIAPDQVARTLALLDDGNTVPFVARYRKEATGGLDEVAIRDIAEHAERARATDQRRAVILSSIEEQGKLDPRLRERIEAASTRAELEDLYLPFKPRRRTKAQVARERGLEPLARRILDQPRDGHPRREAQRFVRGEVGDVDAALEGARHIVSERVAEHPTVRALLREAFERHGALVSTAKKAARAERTRFESWYDYREPAHRVPSHRYLAVCRGEREGVLDVKVEIDFERRRDRVERLARLRRGSPFAGELQAAIDDAWKRLLRRSIEGEARAALKERADRAAVDVFANNLANLLLAAPLGPKAVVGVDPGLRTGCKCAALDASGTFGGHITIYPVRDEARAADELRRFVERSGAAAVAVGNGTGGRETEQLARRALEGLDVVVVQVDEAGASIYSASDVARAEFPDLDLTIRGAISIGRRLQDPLAELVRLDPKSIGVGQYQHDVHQPLLIRKLGEVVEDCVNRVGVDLGTASAPLLAHVAGVGPRLAERIVAHRAKHGPFRRRQSLLDVSGLGPRAFEQCAGFLRIRGGADPLDASGVHPERYPLVERMARDLGVRVADLLGARAATIDLQRYVSDGVGRPTLEDMVAEMGKPGRDPRDAFEPPRFSDAVHSIGDLREGAVLEGVVTNVTQFGAFVDLGVHQDGLVHVSQLADRFVRDPAEVVAAGQRVRVKVLSVDLERKRIALSMKQV